MMASLLLWLFVWSLSISWATDQHSATCQETTLTARRGVVSSPNFPRAFDVPLSCRWVIDASNFMSGNTSIIVYMSQLYVYKGLRITEYAYYESELTNYGAEVIADITEGNVFDFRYVRTFHSYLVLDLKLDRHEGNHVRVLDHLLDVFGFNVTYEITDLAPDPNSCSLRDCSFAGHCLLHGDFQ